MNKRLVEFIVGLFILGGMVSLFILAFKISGISQYSSSNAYTVVAIFDNVGDLKPRAPVTIAGVRIGEVDEIVLDPKTFKAKVTILVDRHENQLPSDTAASILTAGIIGANYISLNPGFSEQNLKEGDVIIDTHPALILENLISQFIYQTNKEKKKEENTK